LSAACGGPAEPGSSPSPSGGEPIAQAWQRLDGLQFADPFTPSEDEDGDVVQGLLDLVEFDGRWIAMVDRRSGAAPMVSDDLVHWEYLGLDWFPVDGELRSFQRHGADLLRIGTIDSGNEVEPNEVFVHYSSDGVEWAPWEFAGAQRPAEIQGLATIGDVTVALGGVPQGDYERRATAWISRGREPFAYVEDTPWSQDSIVGPAVVDGEFVALSEQSVGEEGGIAKIWRSADGRTWTADDSEVPGIWASGVVTLDDRVVFGGRYGAAITVSASGVNRSGPEMPSQLNWWMGWDDEFNEPVAWSDDAALPGMVVERADADFCYDDFATCQRPEARVLVFDENGDMEQVVLPEITEGALLPTSIVIADDRIVLVGTIGREVWKQVGNDGLELHYEEELGVWVFDRVDGSLPTTVPIEDARPNPARHQRLGDEQQPVVGTTYRVTLPIGGGCGAGRFGDGQRHWQTIEPWGDWPYPDDWPVRHVGVMDAPTDYLFGTLTLNADDTISVGIERGDDVEILRTYTPADPPTEFCG
jgi:hypothetical protein